MPDEDDEGHRQWLYYPWDQGSLGEAKPLDRVPLNDLQMRLINVCLLYTSDAADEG